MAAYYYLDDQNSCGLSHVHHRLITVCGDAGQTKIWQVADYFRQKDVWGAQRRIVMSVVGTCLPQNPAQEPPAAQKYTNKGNHHEIALLGKSEVRRTAHHDLPPPSSVLSGFPSWIEREGRLDMTALHRGRRVLNTRR